MIHDKQEFKIAGMRAYSSAMVEHANFDVMMDAKNRLIRELHATEDDALRRAVCRYFGVSDPFDAVKRMQCIQLRDGSRRYIEAGTMTDVIRINAPRLTYEDGKVRASISYKTFDGVK